LSMKQLLEQYHDDFRYNGKAEGSESSLRVLIVDDDEFTRRHLSGILSAVGYEVSGVAVDGADAVARYQEQGPDVVTMDIEMPVLDGIESLKKIREINSRANVVMVSAGRLGQISTMNLLKDSIRCGAIDFILKPVTETNLQRFLMVLKLASQGKLRTMPTG
jgi:two-component system, chemotaxis family, chemotaxis protein CheY